jgi:hypothetical protein
MNWRRFTALSLMLNLGLALGLMHSSRTGAFSAPGRPPTPGGSRREPAPGASAASADGVNHDFARFDWSQVASRDLRAYRDNLRAIGCPEATVRDILTSVVEADYRERVRALIRPYAAQFWDTVARLLADKKIAEDVVESLNQLKSEKNRQLEELFGPNRGQPQEPAFTLDAHQRQLLGFLPEEKQRQYAELQNRFAERLRQPGRTPDGNERPWTPEERQALEREKKEQLRALMTDGEWAEYRLRNSSHSRRLSQLTGIDLSEDDLKALARIRIQADEARGALPATRSGMSAVEMSAAMARRYGRTEAMVAERDDPQAVAEARRIEAQRETITRQAEDQVQAYLGEDRYAQFQRVQNPDYQQIRCVTDRYALPETLAADVQELTRIARDQLEAVQSRGGWTDEQRAAALAGLRAETERTLRQAMGAEVFDTYRRYGGQWVQEIGAQGEPGSD